MFGSWNELRLRSVISSSSAALDHDRGLVEILLRCSRITSLQKTVYYFEFKKLKFCLVNVVSFCKNMNFITEKTPFLKKLGILPASCTQRCVSQKTVTCKKLCKRRLQLTYLETIQKTNEINWQLNVILWVNFYARNPCNVQTFAMLYIEHFISLTLGIKLY